MKRVFLFLSVWLLWWLWISTVGRIPGSLRAPGFLLFDLVAAGMVVLLARIPFAAPTTPFSKHLKSVWTVPAVIAIASAVFYCVLLVPQDCDGLTYHLPPVIEAYQKGRWGNFDNPFFAVRYFPKLVEALNLWWILHFGPRGYIFLSLLPLGLGAWACVRLCEALRIPARYSVALWCTIPIVVKQAATLYIDGFVAVFGICAVLALEAGSFPLFAVSLALFAGAKPSAYVACGVLLVYWFIKQRPKAAKLAIVVTLCVASCLASLLPTYLERGNPLYPFTIQVAGHVIFPGIEPTTTVSDAPFFPLRLSESTLTERLAFSYLHSKPIAYWDMIQGAYGFPLLIAGLAGLLTALDAFARRRVKVEGSEIAVGAAVSPSLWMPRYHIWATAGLIAWASRLLARLPKAVCAVFWSALFLQSLWLWTDRVWIVGQKEAVAAALQAHDARALLALMSNRWSELKAFGEPQTVTDPWDHFRNENRGIDHSITLCGEGPEMTAVLYGRDMKNTVLWAQPNSGKCENGVFKP